MFAVEYVSVQLFTWVIGILVSIFLAISGVVFGVLNKRISSLSQQVTSFSNHLGEVTGDIKEIRTDINWIKSTLIEIKDRPASR